TAEGLRAGALVTYLPPTLKPELADGRFRAKLEANLAPAAGGKGQQLGLNITSLDFRDGADGPALLRIDGAAVKVKRFDPEVQVIAMHEISLNGLESQVRQRGAGMHLMGFGLVEAPPSPAAPQPAEKAKPQAAAAPVVDPNPGFVAAPAAPTTAPAAAEI